MPDYENVITVAEKLTRLLEVGHIQDATAVFLDQTIHDQADIFIELAEAHQNLLLEQLDISTTAGLFDELEDDETLDAAEGMPLDRLADVLDEMEPDEAADLLGDLPTDVASQALAQMDEPAGVLPLLGFEDETAGGRMTTSFVALWRHKTATDAIQYLREVSPENNVPYYLFVTDKAGRMAGVVGLRELVITKPDTVIETIMNPEVVYVTTDTDQEEAAQMMAKYDLGALPVLDGQHHLVGVITGDDLIDVLQEEATEDIYHMANVTDTDLEPDSPIGMQVRGRLPWLFINTATALFGAWVISQYEHIIAQVAVLAVFQSVIAGQGGNAGAQSVAMIVRALALDKIDPRQVWRVMGRQVLVGLIQGLIVGAVVGTIAGVVRGNFALGAIIFVAMLGNMIVAGAIGTLAPLGLKAIGQDPALASSVLVTAVTDSVGFFLFLSLAARVLV